MLILVSNDDGITSPGIKALAEGLQQLGEVLVVAPDREQSAAGHAITIANPLRVNEVRHHGKLFGYSVDGTPADCVKIGIHAILDRKPDLVVSGINQGANYASNIIYSGTVSAATEGTILGVPSIALSMDSFLNQDFSRAVELSLPIVKKVGKEKLPHGTLLNVNLPAPEKEHKGIKVCRQSDRIFQVRFEKRYDMRGQSYFWQGGEMDMNDPDPETDIRALADGYTTITPIEYNLTDRDFMKKMERWEW